jgi:hypothetical protein
LLLTSAFSHKKRLQSFCDEKDILGT